MRQCKTFITVGLDENESMDQLENEGLLRERSVKQMFERTGGSGRLFLKQRRDCSQAQKSQDRVESRLTFEVRGHGHTWAKTSDISNWFRRRAGRVSVLSAAAGIFYLTSVGPENVKITEPKFSSSTCTAARSRTEAAVMIRPQLELNLCLWKKKKADFGGPRP